MERYQRVVVIRAGERFVNLNTLCRNIGYTADEAATILEGLKNEKAVVEVLIGIEPRSVAYECVRGVTIEPPKSQMKVDRKKSKAKRA